MVRLKEVHTTLEVHISEFQFLMVRLKEPQFAVLSAFFYISIPYGAIKSYIETHQFQYMYIHFNSLWCD